MPSNKSILKAIGLYHVHSFEYRIETYDSINASLRQRRLIMAFIITHAPYKNRIKHVFQCFPHCGNAVINIGNIIP